MWLFFAILAASGMAGVDINKKALASKVPPVMVGWFLHGSSLLILIPLLIASNTFAVPSWPVFVIIAVAAVLTGLGLHLQQRAYAEGELSLLEPIQQLLPAVVVVASYLINRDLPSDLALGGIAFIMVGIYGLRRHRHDRSLLDPLRHLFKDPAVILMVMSILLYGFSTAIDKFALNYAAPLVYVVMLNVVLLFTNSLSLWQQRPKFRKLAKKYRGEFLRLGVASGIQQGAQILALQRASAGNVIAIRDVGIIFVVWYGSRVLGENRHWWQRWTATVIITGGALLVALAQGV